MNNTNKLVTSDNVGYAAILLEKHLNPGAFVGHGNVVTAFASANLGDSSPNIEGPKCEYTGLPCDLLTSTCRPKEGACFASGPGRDQFESCKIIGTRIYYGARQLLEKNTARELSGPINFIHQFIDMSAAKATFLNTTSNQVEEVGIVIEMLLNCIVCTISFGFFFVCVPNRFVDVRRPWVIALQPEQLTVDLNIFTFVYWFERILNEKFSMAISLWVEL